MRKKHPYIALLDQVRITRRGETAIIEYADREVATTHFEIGLELAGMTDGQILERWNECLMAQARLAAKFPGFECWSLFPEYRQRIVELARAGRSLSEVARQFEPTVGTIRAWVKQAELDEGLRSDGLTTDERAELNRLQRGRSDRHRRSR
ncbi:MAG: transposase [Candidatus Binataceae bacterium]